MSATLAAVALAGLLVSGCSTSGSDLPSACAVFDRGYTHWHAAARPPDNAAFLTALDQAVSDAGTSDVGSALQAAAAAIRELQATTTTHQQKSAQKLLALAITEIRKTCPPV